MEDFLHSVFLLCLSLHLITMYYIGDQKKCLHPAFGTCTAVTVHARKSCQIPQGHNQFHLFLCDPPWYLAHQGSLNICSTELPLGGRFLNSILCSPENDCGKWRGSQPNARCCGDLPWPHYFSQGQLAYSHSITSRKKHNENKKKPKPNFLQKSKVANII